MKKSEKFIKFLGFQGYSGLKGYSVSEKSQFGFVVEQRRKCLRLSQSQRDCVLQPRVARNELPWVGGPLDPNPERVLSNTLNRNLEQRAAKRRPFSPRALHFVTFSDMLF